MAGADLMYEVYSRSIGQRGLTITYKKLASATLEYIFGGGPTVQGLAAVQMKNIVEGGSGACRHYFWGY